MEKNMGTFACNAGMDIQKQISDTLTIVGKQNFSVSAEFSIV